MNVGAFEGMHTVSEGPHKDVWEEERKKNSEMIKYQDCFDGESLLFGFLKARQNGGW